MVHVSIGYVLTLNFIWRFVWAFLGNRYARWSAILPFGTGYWGKLRGYVHAFLTGEPQHYVGHNPAARIGIALLLLLILDQVVTGLILAGTDLFWPPFGGRFASWVAASGIDPATVSPLASNTIDQTAYQAMRALRRPIVTTHLYAFYALAVMIVLHLIAVVLTEVHVREKSHQYPPEHRGGQPQPPEHQASEPTLQRRNCDRPENSSEDRIGHLKSNLREFRLRQWQIEPRGLRYLFPIAQQVEQEVKGQQQVSYSGKGGAQDGAAPGSKGRGRHSYHIRKIHLFMDPLQCRGKRGMLAHKTRPVLRVEHWHDNCRAPDGFVEQRPRYQDSRTTTMQAVIMAVVSAERLRDPRRLLMTKSSGANKTASVIDQTRAPRNGFAMNAQTATPNTMTAARAVGASLRPANRGA